MGIDLYVGINETKWNHHPVDPGPYACISPVYGSSSKTKKENSVWVPPETEVYEDSGAFCDGPGERLTFEQARDRQLAHAKKYNYLSQVTAMASYDLLIDEKWEDGVRHKERWTREEAWGAVDETVRAAAYMVQHRPVIDRQPIPLILSAQGVDAEQYLSCAERLISLFSPGDIFGLGGWCIIGKMPKRMGGAFQETIQRVIPFAARYGITKIHIWGVLYAPALGPLLWLCNQHGLSLSTDSAGPSIKPAAFGDWGYADWRDKDYERHPVETRGLERARHVRATRAWLADFENTKYYHKPEFRKESKACYSQLSFL